MNNNLEMKGHTHESIQFIGSMSSVQYFGGRRLPSFHQIVDGVGILGLQIGRETFVAQIVKVFVTSLFPHDESYGT